MSAAARRTHGLGAPPAQIVTFADVAADQQFFFEHPERRYRLSDRWAVRRRGGVFLRSGVQMVTVRL